MQGWFDKVDALYFTGKECESPLEYLSPVSVRALGNFYLFSSFSKWSDTVQTKMSTSSKKETVLARIECRRV